MKLQRTILALAGAALVAAAAPATAKDGYGSATEAEAMVAAAVAHIKKDGTGAYADFTDRKSPYADRDLYVVVYSMDGKALAHGQNPKMVGKDLIDLKDPDGKEFIRERVTLAKTKPAFWQDYKFTDPVTKKVLPKSAYCQKAADAVVCVGVYKR